MRLAIFRYTVTAVVVCAAAAMLPAPASAQLCKWVDENGTVHYSQNCPEGSGASAVEIQDGPLASDDPYAGAGQGNSDKRKGQRGGTQARERQPNYESMSASQLAAECERAREARLKPEREALIRECQAEGQDAGYCQSFYATHGDGGRQGGRTVPRKYDNLPPCQAARRAQGQ